MGLSGGSDRAESEWWRLCALSTLPRVQGIVDGTRVPGALWAPTRLVGILYIAGGVV